LEALPRQAVENHGNDSFVVVFRLHTLGQRVRGRTKLLKPLTAEHAWWSHTPNASGVEALDVEAAAANPKFSHVIVAAVLR
jgi:hypothetical protein